MNISIFFRIAIILFSCLQCIAQTGSIDNRTKHVIDSLCNAHLAFYKAAGVSIAIIDNGEIVYATGYGFADVSAGRKADEHTVYRIGSCTKAFTALAIMQLQERGKLSVQSSMKQYLHELSIPSRFNDANDIIVADVLSHTSGLPCDVTNGIFCDAPPDMKWLIASLNKQTTMAPRRYMYAYSNVGYGILGEVIARIGAQSYEEYLHDNIFLPLGMRSTSASDNVKCDSLYSTGYFLKKKQLMEFKEPMIRDQGAGSIYSNATDMAQFIIMLLKRGVGVGSQIVASSSLDEMEKNKLSDLTLPSGDSYGFGLDLEYGVAINGNDTSEIYIAGHTGDTYAFHASFVYIPALNVGAVSLTNTHEAYSLAKARTILGQYLYTAHRIKIRNNQMVPATNKSSAQVALTGAETKGNYNCGPFLIKVKNPKRITFSQGPARVIFRPKKDELGFYKAKARIFGIVPVKISNQEFFFEQLNNQNFLKVRFLPKRNEEFIGVKETGGISDSWKKNIGTYIPIQPVYPCTNCPVMNFANFKIELKKKGDFIVMNQKGTSADTKGTSYLNIVNDSLAVTGGIGRGTGESVKVLPNGNLYYSGIELSKKK